MIKSRFYWKELSSDGLLKNYQYSFGYYESELNSYGGYENEEEAIKDLNEKMKTIKYGRPSDLILVKIFNYEAD